MPRDPRPAAYLLRRRFAEGGHGELWEAIQASLNRIVAVKRIKRAVLKDPDTRLRARYERAFRCEAMVAGHLDHPNIVPIYDLGEDAEGRPLLAMKLVAGTCWADLLYQDRTRLPPDEFLLRHLAILATVARATGFAHARGIIHRDLKPGQVIVGNYGETYLMDWGVAAIFDADLAAPLLAGEPRPPLTVESHGFSGTVAYMSPEQADGDGRRQGPWTDVYLLGSCLFEVLTGQHPHSGERSAAIESAKSGRIPDLAAVVPHPSFPAEILTILEHCMAAEPGRRYRTGTEVHEALAAHIAGTARRHEAARLLDEATRRLALPAPRYDDFAAADECLTKAAALAPGSPAIRAARDRLLEGEARAALAADDLALARTRAAGISVRENRDPLLAEVGTRLQRRALHARQRVAALWATFALTAAAAFGTTALISHRVEAALRAEQLRAGEVLQEAERRTTEAAAAETAAEAALRARITALYRDEADLVREFDSVVSPLSEGTSLRILPTETAAAAALGRDRGDAILAQVLEVKTRRRELDPLAPLASTPFRLAYMEALLAIHFRPAHLPEVRDTLTAVLKDADRENAYYALNLARVHFLLREFDECEAVIRRAFAHNLTGRGFRQEQRSNLRFLHDSATERWKEFRIGAGDILIEPRAEITAGRTRYEEIEGNWIDTSNPAEWARSAAPGIAVAARLGTRAVRFRDTQDIPTTGPVKGPAVARYIPRPATPTRFHVYATWPLAGNASPVYYKVRHAGGESITETSQDGWGALGTSNANRWVYLGHFQFAGPEHHVEFRCEPASLPPDRDWNHQVNADALLFARERMTEGALDALPPPPARMLAPGAAINWYRARVQANDAARAGNRPVLIYVHFSHTAHHLLISEDVFGDPQVAQTITARFVPYTETQSAVGRVEHAGVRVQHGQLVLARPDGSLLATIAPADAMTTATLLARLNAALAEFEQP